MPWNDNFYGKDGYKITPGSDDQDVYDSDGKHIGYYDGGTVENHPGGDTLGTCNDDD